MRSAILTTVITLALSFAAPFFASTGCDVCTEASYVPTYLGEETICDLYPFTANCDEPTAKKCRTVISDNPGICEHEYIICQAAKLVAECGVCPPECDGIESACPWLDG